jgi:hypothetical protein
MTKNYTAIETFDTAKERLDRFKELKSNKDLEFKLKMMKNTGPFEGFDKFLLEYTVIR